MSLTMPNLADAVSMTKFLNGVNKGTDTKPVGGAHPGHKIAGRSATAYANLNKVNSWPSARHYMFPVDPNNINKALIPAAPTSRVWYFASDGADQDAIAADPESGTSNPVTVTYDWLKSASNLQGYGLRSDRPLLYDGSSSIGFTCYRLDFQPNQASAPWQRNDGPHHALFKAGQTFSTGLQDSSGVWSAGAQPDPMFPEVCASFGTANESRAFCTNPAVRVLNGPMPPQNTVYMGWHHGGHELFSFNCGGENILIQDNYVNSPGGDGFVFQGSSSGNGFPEGTYRVTAAYNFIDRCKRDVPGNGTYWKNGDRSSGVFTSEYPGMLMWKNVVHKAGWDPSHFGDGHTYNAGQYGQPPSNQGHDHYATVAGYDYISGWNLFTEPTGNLRQARAGIVTIGDLNAEVQLGNLVSYGTAIYNTDAGTAFQNGEEIRNASKGDALVGIHLTNFGVPAGSANINPPPTAAERLAADVQPGDTLRGVSSGVTGTYTSIRQYAQYSGLFYETNVGLLYNWYTTDTSKDDPAFCAPSRMSGGYLTGGVDGEFSFVRLGFFNAWNPGDPGDKAAKTAMRPGLPIDQADTDLDPVGDAHKFHALDGYIAYQAGDPSTEYGTGGMTPAQLDQITLAQYVDNLTGSGDGTYTTAITNLLARTDRNHHAKAFWNHRAARTGEPTLSTSPGARISFFEDTRADGWNALNPINWRRGGNEDLPVDGDDLTIPAGASPVHFDTLRVGDIAFGAGSSWIHTGGELTFTSFTGTASLKTELSGQIALKGSAHTGPVVIEGNGGRFRFEVNASDVSGSLSGKSHMVIMDAATVEVPAGKALTIDGADCKIFLDDAFGFITTLAIGGTLNFIAGTDYKGDAGFSTIVKARSGAYGYADLGGGVQGQPAGGNAIGTVALGSGSTITVDTTGLSPGTYDLIDVDSLVDNGANLPSGVAVNGNKLQVVVP